MEMTDVENAIKRVMAAALMALLCGCATKPPASVAGVDAGSSRSLAAGQQNGKTGGEDNVFKDQQVINPNPAIEKDKLQVSYNMKAVHSESGYLLQLSLIFRNQKDKSVLVRPDISLLNNKGHRIEAYSKNGFLKSVSSMKGKAAVRVTNSLISADSQTSAQERIDWANSYWLKDRFSISAQGIEIGELVYHCVELQLPMTLIVNAAHQKYVFNIKDSLSVVDEPRSEPASSH